MKKTLLALFICALAGTASLQAQGPEKPSQRFAIKINPLSLFLITGNIQFEAAVAPRISVQLGVAYTGITVGSGNGSNGTGKISYNLLALTPEMRYYILNKEQAPRGLYVAPFARVRTGVLSASSSVYDPDSGTYIDAEAKTKLLTTGGGLTVGYQLVTAGGFVFDVYMGPQFSIATVEVSAECSGCDGDEQVEAFGRGTTTGPGLRFGMAIGYAF